MRLRDEWSRAGECSLDKGAKFVLLLIVGSMGLALYNLL